MLKRIGLVLIGILVAAVVWDVLKEFGADDSSPKVTTVDGEIDSPTCMASGKDIFIAPAQAAEVEATSNKSPLSPLLAMTDEKTVIYDFAEMKKRPPEYRDFMLRAECARILLDVPPGQATLETVRISDCAAIKRLRDERGYTRERLEALKAVLATDAVLPAAQTSQRLSNLTACFEDAPPIPPKSPSP